MLDKKLLRADVLHLDETSVLESTESRYQIPGFIAAFGSVGNGKGVVTYTREDHMQHIITSPKFQIVKMDMTQNLDSINVYRSSDGSILDTLEVNGKVDHLDKVSICFFLSGFEICH